VNARQRRESASFQAAGGSIEVYTLRSRIGPALLRLLGLGRRRQPDAVVMHMPPGRWPR